ncbi:MAG: polyphenol oxidase family protein [bacterium]|nr:polyphenol oxidase family protein [bacterium]
MISAAGTATGFVRTLESPTGGATRRVRARVIAKADPELAAIYAQANETTTEADLRRSERDLLAGRYGLPVERVIMLQQVHGDRALEIPAKAFAPGAIASGPGNHEPPSAINATDPIDPAGATGAIFFDEGDALYSGESGVLLVIRTADCLPLFFDLSLNDSRQSDSAAAAHAPHSESKSIVGIIHAGWRGLAAGIISRTLVEALAKLRGSGHRSGEFRGRFFFGPCIGAESYEVGADVADHFTHKQSLPEAGKYLLDLAANARLEIDRALAGHARDFGMDPAEVAANCEFLNDGPGNQGCTYQSNDLYFSHRRGDRGRNLNAILIEE